MINDGKMYKTNRIIIYSMSLSMMVGYMKPMKKDIFLYTCEGNFIGHLKYDSLKFIKNNAMGLKTYRIR